MKNRFYYLIFTLLAVLGSCSADSDPVSGNGDLNSPLGMLEVTMAPRRAPDGDTGDNGGDTGGDSGSVGDDDADGEPIIDPRVYNVDDLIPYELKFDESTILQVSQQTRAIPPFFDADRTYDFSYIEDSDATWDDELSYNFAPYEQDDPLEWNKIADGGSLNGGFALYCMYFPVENKIRQKEGENGMINYYVEQDQSTIEGLMKSDILGAYHSTPTLFSRIRFRLFHLMTYLRIRLYVPVYDDDLNTGYREGALLSATLDNVTPDFAIDWNAIRSSDTQGPAVSPLEGEGQIKMYQHPLAPGQKEHEIVRINIYDDFLRPGFIDQGIEGNYDRVRIYDFSVILPNQKGIVGEDGKESNFTDTEFLNFYLRTNAGSTTRYYFKQSYSAKDNQSSLEMNQGIFQYVQLYVPRVGNQAIYVGGTVKPWTNKGADFMLSPEEVE